MKLKAGQCKLYNKGVLKGRSLINTCSYSDHNKEVQHMNKSLCASQFNLIGWSKKLYFLPILQVLALLKMSLPLLGLLNGSIKKTEIFINFVNNSFR